MARRIWIIAKKDKVEQSDIDDAKANNCPEIANGIPPALQYAVHDFDLPCAYEEPESPLPEPPRSTHFARIDSFHPAELKPLRVVRTWEGKEYTYDCFVTETLKDQYLVGDVVVGDYVLVHFDDSDRKVAMLKIFKSW